MSEARYDVVFSGELYDGFELDEVKANVARLFRQAEDKIEALFSQPTVTIKADLEKPAAEKYLQAMAKAGARVELLEKNRLSTASLSIEPIESTKAESDPQNGSESPVSAAESFGIANVVAPGREIQPKVPAKQEPEPEADDSGDGDERSDNREASDTESRSLPFKFTGNGTEYFKIWIVNIFLTIITLGIYSAWAKVRNNRYFYSNTHLDGSTFEYLANPLSILKGRVIAVVFFLLYTGAGSVLPILGVVLALLLLLILPWLVVKSLSFNARNSAYRNVTFGFKGSVMGAVGAFIGWPLLAAFSAGLLVPFVFYKQQKYMVDGYRYGTTDFKYGADVGDYYMIFLIAFGVLVGGVIVGSLLGVLFPPLAVVGVLIAYLYTFALFAVKTKNLVYNTAQLGNHGFNSTLELNSYAWLFFTNTLFTLLTVGLFIPWAKVRTANYMAEHLSLEASGDLNGFIADEQEQVSALGEELGDVFDFDIGL